MVPAIKAARVFTRSSSVTPIIHMVCRGRVGVTAMEAPRAEPMAKEEGEP